LLLSTFTLIDANASTFYKSILNPEQLGAIPECRRYFERRVMECNRDYSRDSAFDSSGSQEEQDKKKEKEAMYKSIGQYQPAPRDYSACYQAARLDFLRCIGRGGLGR
jgi:hypothetical protein